MDKPMNAWVNSHYFRLFVMAVLSFIAMYILMYAMVDTFTNVIPSFNQFYMAGLMTAPMVALEVLLMKSMYHNKKANTAIVAISIVVMIIFFLLIRQQTAISDKEFLRSMIPHHAGAILMCKKANLKDPEIKQLCEAIIAGQQTEIDLMKRKLDTLDTIR